MQTNVLITFNNNVYLWFSWPDHGRVTDEAWIAETSKYGPSLKEISKIYFKSQVFLQKALHQTHRVFKFRIYSRTSMARTPWNHENMFETGVVRANEC